MAETLKSKNVLSYEEVLDRLERSDTRLALAACVVEESYPNAAGIANDILRFCAHRYPGVDIVGEYILRVAGLGELQNRFDVCSRVEFLGDPSAVVPRDRYNISLLLSIVLTNHRFEIMRELDRFLRRLGPETRRIASIGTGTGFELRLIASALPPGLRIESYDIDPSAKEEAVQYLRFFGIEPTMIFAIEFPLDSADASFENAFDALILCEVLEHLPNPARALANVRNCLAEDGHAFLTMAVNIAQEDHIFLYEDLECCQRQIRDAGLEIVREWITPQTAVIPPADPANRAIGFRKGNYVADTIRRRG
jgi:SAM-dependent methyltransferase